MYFIPDHVSPEAKDLIKKMLVVDPARRITVRDWEICYMLAYDILKLFSEDERDFPASLVPVSAA